MPALKPACKPGEASSPSTESRSRGMPLDVVEKLIRGEARYGRRPSRRIRITARPRTHVRRSYARRDSRSVGPREDGRRLSLHSPTDFGQTSADEVRERSSTRKRTGAKGYILDLRDNGGGLLDAAVDISSLLVPQGTIVATIDRDGVTRRAMPPDGQSDDCCRS